MKTFDRKDIFTIATAEDAKKYVGKLGYPSNSLNKLKTLINNFAPYSLDKIDLDNDKPFFYREDGFLFFLPADKVKEVKEEKKWRAFEDHNEFKAWVGKNVGETIRTREISSKYDTEDLITRLSDKTICLASTYYTYDELFNQFEWLNPRNEWQPFGVEE